MSDTTTLRDHSQPCEHGEESWAVQGRNGLWICNKIGCPGGREHTYRQVPIVDSYRTYDVPSHIEAKVNVGQMLEEDHMWLEVSDE